MPETKTSGATIKIKFFTKWRLKFLDFANRFLFFFNLKDTKHFWGIIYDSVSKQPLDPVIVKLVYTDGYEIEQAITDMGGGYGFLARKGKFKILPRKTNYTFPSKIITGTRDGIYENLYHGEFFNLYDENEVVSPNIPMDPEGFDWNQKAKLQVAPTFPHRKWFFRRLFGVLFWLSFIFCLSVLAVGRSIGLYSILGTYFFVILLAVCLPEPRLWGEIIVKGNGPLPTNLILEMHIIDFPSVILGKGAVNENGKFLLRTKKGKYLLSISSVDALKGNNLLASIAVTIGQDGLFNDSLILEVDS